MNNKEQDELYLKVQGISDGLLKASKNWKENKYNESDFPDKKTSFNSGFANGYLSAQSKIMGLADAAFVAGRGKTSWAQFKKDHGI